MSNYYRCNDREVPAFSIKKQKLLPSCFSNWAKNVLGSIQCLSSVSEACSSWFHWRFEEGHNHSKVREIRTQGEKKKKHKTSFVFFLFLANQEMHHRILSPA